MCSWFVTARIPSAQVTVDHWRAEEWNPNPAVWSLTNQCCCFFIEISNIIHVTFHLLCFIQVSWSANNGQAISRMYRIPASFSSEPSQSSAVFPCCVNLYTYDSLNLHFGHQPTHWRLLRSTSSCILALHQQHKLIFSLDKPSDFLTQERLWVFSAWPTRHYLLAVCVPTTATSILPSSLAC